MKKQMKNVISGFIIASFSLLCSNISSAEPLTYQQLLIELAVEHNNPVLCEDIPDCNE